VAKTVSMGWTVREDIKTYGGQGGEFDLSILYACMEYYKKNPFIQRT
jgi:hypothetical protein